MKRTWWKRLLSWTTLACLSVATLVVTAGWVAHAASFRRMLYCSRLTIESPGVSGTGGSAPSYRRWTLIATAGMASVSLNTQDRLGMGVTPGATWYWKLDEYDPTHAVSDPELPPRAPRESVSRYLERLQEERTCRDVRERLQRVLGRAAWRDTSFGDTSLTFRLWPPLALLSAVVCAGWALYVRRSLRERRRLGLGRCPACNYDRAGIAKSAVCPECGKGGGLP